jgi:hypothetical protein
MEGDAVERRDRKDVMRTSVGARRDPHRVWSRGGLNRERAEGNVERRMRPGGGRRQPEREGEPVGDRLKRRLCFNERKVERGVFDRRRRGRRHHVRQVHRVVVVVAPVVAAFLVVNRPEQFEELANVDVRGFGVARGIGVGMRVRGRQPRLEQDQDDRN